MEEMEKLDGRDFIVANKHIKASDIKKLLGGKRKFKFDVKYEREHPFEVISTQDKYGIPTMHTIIQDEPLQISLLDKQGNYLGVLWKNEEVR